MKIIDVSFAVLRFQYKVARFPLQLIEERIVARMDSEAPGRLFYERSLAALDVTVGNALNDTELEQRGAALAERSDALRKAAELDAAAEAEVREANQEFKTRRDKAIKQEQNAQGTKRQSIEDARAEADERKRNTAQAAQKRTAEAKQRADQTAAQRTNAVETAKRDEQARIKAAEQNATKLAQAKLEDARDKRGDAAVKRGQADRVEELADVEKEKRQAARANNGGS